MRLIDADELKQHAFIIYQPNGLELESFDVVVVSVIDNAPTVEIPVARWDCYCEGQKVGYEKALSERPQGEWIFMRGVTCGGYYKCSNCGEVERAEKNFCPNCGAKMKGGAE